MAQDEIIIKLRVEDGDLKISTANIDKQSKSIDKNTKKKKQGTKGSNRFNRAEKALYQTNLSASKGFSKMNQTMGGSSGLVAAYATLAANVFAATAAFGALSRASQFENLKKGLSELGAQSGRTLSVMAQGLRDVTGGAISAEEAMRAAAMGVSGGFGGEELAGLAKIAKGASIALGRSLPDAFDRLTRGAIKLEPEILDELGIMVRVDEAAENYAATIGKTANTLTQYEKRQAFMNAILEQGEAKFGEIADAVETDPYARLAATFDDLVKSIFTFVNETLRLGDIIGFLADNTGALLGVMILFGSTIAGKMLPALGEAGLRASKAADHFTDMADATLKQGDATRKLMGSTLGLGDVGSGAYKDMAAEIRKGEYDINKLKDAQKSLNATRGQLGKKGLGKKKIAENKIKLRQLDAEERKLRRIMKVEVQLAALRNKAARQRILGASAEASAQLIQSYSVGASTFSQSFKGINDGFSTLWSNLNKNSLELVKGGKGISTYTKNMNMFKAATQAAAGHMRLLGTALLKALPWIGALVVISAALYAIWDKLWNTDEHKAYVKSNKELDKILGELPKKAEKYHKALENSLDVAAGQVRAFNIISGVVDELNKKLLENIKLRRESNETRPGPDESLGMGRIRAVGLSDDLGKGGVGNFWRPEEFEELGDRWNEMPAAARAAFLMIKDSPEAKGMIGFLSSDIPELVDDMSSKLAGMDLGALTFEDLKDKGFAEEWAAKVMKLVGEVTIKWGGLGPAITGLQKGLGESERDVSTFLATFGKKTSVDKMALSLNAVVNSLNDVREAVELASGEEEPEALAENVGKALMDVGAKTASLIGPAFEAAQKSVRDIGTELDNLKKTAPEDLEGISAMEGDLKGATVALGEMEPEYRAIVDLVNEVQLNERRRKIVIDGINKSLKVAEKHYKVSVKLAGLGNKLLKQRLGFEKKILEDQLKLNDLSKVVFEHMKIVRDEKTQLLTSIQEDLDLSGFILLSERERKNIIIAQGIDKNLLNAALQVSLEIGLKQLEIDRAVGKQSHIMAQQAAEAGLAAIERQNKLNELKEVENKLNTQLLNFIQRGTTGLDPYQAALAKIDAADREFQFASNKADMEMAILDAKGQMQIIDIQILNAQAALYNTILGKKKGDEGFITPLPEKEITGHIDEATRLAKKAVRDNVENLRLGLIQAVNEGYKAVKETVLAGLMSGGQAAMAGAELGRRGAAIPGTTIPLTERTPAGTSLLDQLEGEEDANKRDAKLRLVRTNLETLKASTAEWTETMKAFGPEGEAASETLTGLFGVADGFMAISTAAGTAEEIAQQKMKGIGDILSSMASIMAASSKARIAGVDREIEAEKNRDGKSKESLSKIKALEAKKDKLARKAFERQKKMQIASAVISTAAAIAGALGSPPVGPWNVAIAAMMGAMGLAQIAIIKKQQYQGTGADQPSTPAEITVGDRTNKVDVSKQASAGELAYLRGIRGIGTTATNFVAQGGAAGLRQGYAGGKRSGGILVGERGPEVIQPLSPFNVIPNDMGAKSHITANFTIHAIDAVGVEEVLMAQQGNIISMIRSAANDYGENFLEIVDTDNYGDFSGTPQSGGGIDY